MVRPSPNFILSTVVLSYLRMGASLHSPAYMFK